MLDKGFIHKSTFPTTTPLLLATKPSGSIRICYDYYSLNIVTIKN